MTKKFNELVFETKNFKKETVRTVIVDPHLAADFLSRNIENRPIRPRVLKQYTEEMINGDWVFNGDPFIFCDTGNMMNGQHRCKAIIASNTTQKMNIQTGVLQSSYVHIDTNQVRGGSDTVFHYGYKSSAVVCNIVRFIILYNQAEKQKTSYSAAKTCSNKQIRDWLDAHENEREHIIECVNFGKFCWGKTKLIPSNQYAAYLYLFSTKSKEKAFEFMRMLSTGEDCSSYHNSSVYLLRAKLINIMSSSVMLRQDDKKAFFIKAWILFINKREVKKLVLKDNGYRYL